jgi:hypothetical protein
MHLGARKLSFESGPLPEGIVDSLTSSANKDEEQEEKDEERPDFMRYEFSYSFFGAVIASVAVGVICYMYLNDWKFSTALFYAVNTLLGVLYGIKNKNDSAEWFTVLYFIYGVFFVALVIGSYVGFMITNASQIAAMERRKLMEVSLAKNDTRGRRINVCRQYVRYKIISYIQWDEHGTKYITFMALFVWMLVGSVTFKYFEDWDIGYSLLFALSTVSATCSLDPPCDYVEGQTDCELGTAREIILTVYVIVGLPLFTLALGQTANFMIERTVRNYEMKIMRSPLSNEEYNFAANMYGNDSKLSLGEFTMLELLRLRRVTVQDLDQINELFRYIDRQNSGQIDKPMLAKYHLMDEIDGEDESHTICEECDKQESSDTISVSADITPSPSVDGLSSDDIIRALMTQDDQAEEKSYDLDDAASVVSNVGSVVPSMLLSLTSSRVKKSAKSHAHAHTQKGHLKQRAKVHMYEDREEDVPHASSGESNGGEDKNKADEIMPLMSDVLSEGGSGSGVDDITPMPPRDTRRLMRRLSSEQFNDIVTSADPRKYFKKRVKKSKKVSKSRSRSRSRSRSPRGGDTSSRDPSPLSPQSSSDESKSERGVNTDGRDHVSRGRSMHVRRAVHKAGGIEAAAAMMHTSSSHGRHASSRGIASATLPRGGAESQSSSGGVRSMKSYGSIIDEGKK